MSRANYTVAQFAERLGVCQATVYKMIRRQELKSFTFGRSIRISGAEVARIEGECGSSESTSAGTSRAKTQTDGSGVDRSRPRIATRPNGTSVIFGSRHGES